MTTDELQEAAPSRVTPAVEYSVLGPVTVLEGADSLAIGGPKQRSVLAMLIANHGNTVSVDAIAQALYDDDAPDRARRRVQTYVSSLRAIVGDDIVKDRTGWHLSVPRDRVDALRFEDLYESVRDATELAPEAVAAVLRDALALWRGHPYADVESHGFLDPEMTRLGELRVSVLAARIEADLASGRAEDLIGEIEALLVEHPYHEGFRAQHMLALYRAHRQQEALRSYEAMRMTLLEGFGVDPGPELQQLEQRILNHDPSLQLSSGRSIQRRAVMVADPGDALEMARMTTSERETALEHTARALERAVETGAGVRAHVAGTASYAVFDRMAQALTAAEDMSRAADGFEMRVAVDWGDIEVADDSISGPPVSRAAVLVAASHRGQVLLTAEAQQALMNDGDGAGTRFEALGTYTLTGIEKPLPIFQMLVGNSPATFPPLVTDRTPPPLPGRGDRSVPGYELREPIGSGSVGTLYRAYQPSVGREVLIEVIGRSDSSSSEFIRRFEADAQRLALIEHPAINPVVDYWRDTDGAFLVYRQHRGGFLSNPAADYDAETVIAQVGAALAHAHSLGLVHGSVRPDRIALDESGNAYLLGFPVAGSRPQPHRDFGAYVAPETRAGKPATAQTDLFALGVLAHALLVDPSVLDDDGLSVSAAIAEAMAEDPVRRPDSVPEFLAALNPQRQAGPETRYTEVRNPYKGLSAFYEGDAADFYGRSVLVAELTDKLTTSRLLAVIGPSGIGKSSVVRAGVVPALRSGVIPGSDAWLVTDMLPGSHPFQELLRGLERVSVDIPPTLRDDLIGQRRDALASLDRALPTDTELLVIIDQFEELFTMTDESVAAAFMDLLHTAATLEHARVIITLRADFLDRPLLYSEFGELLGSSMVTVAAPTSNELAEAIVGPASSVGVAVDGGLVERMTAEVLDRPGALPLLQHTLTELFEARKSDRLDLSAYESVGRVTGSLALRAEATYTSLDETQRVAAKQALLRMVSVIDDAAPTRRRVRVVDLEDLRAQEAIEAFTRRRLLVADTDPETRTPTVEVAHEVLLSRWPRLTDWIDASRHDLAMARRLDDATRDWSESGRDKTFLLTGGRLAQHQAWTSATSLALPVSTKEFLEESAASEATAASRRRRRRNWITAGFAAAAVVASLFGVLALGNAQTARENERVAEESAAEAEAAAEQAILSARVARGEALAASSAAVIGEDSELAVLLGIAALERAPHSPSAAAALNEALQAHRIVYRVPAPADGTGFAFGSVSPDGRLIAVTRGEALQVWESGTEDGPLWTSSRGEDAGYETASFSTDGTLVVTYSGRAVEVLDAETGSLIALVETPGLRPFFAGQGQSGPFVDVAQPMVMLDDDAGRLATLDLVSGEIDRLQPQVDPFFAGPPTFDESRSRLASSDGEVVRVGDLATGEVLLEVEGTISVLNRDGDLVLAGGNPLELWHVDDGEKLREFHGGSFGVAWFSSDEAMVYGATREGAVMVFDLESGDRLFELRAGVTDTLNVQMTDDQRFVATFDSGGNAHVWEIGSPLLATTGPASFQSGEDGLPATFAARTLFTTDANVLAGRGGFDGGFVLSTAVYDQASGELVNSYPGLVLDVSSDGRRAVYQRTGSPVLIEGEGSFTPIGRLVVADALTGEPVVELDGWCDWLLGFRGESYEIVRSEECSAEAWAVFTQAGTFSADGSLFAAKGRLGRVAVWNATTGQMIWNLDPNPENAREETEASFGAEGVVAFSPDGHLLAYSIGNDLEVRETATWTIAAPPIELQPLPSQMEFTPDGTRLIYAGNTVGVIDTTSWEETELEGQQGFRLFDIDIDPTGRFVATAGFGTDSWVWDLETMTQTRVFEFPALDRGLRNVEWVDEETLLVGTRQAAVLITLDTQALADTARLRLTRTFTAAECATYLVDPCPTLEDIRSDS